MAAPGQEVALKLRDDLDNMQTQIYIISGIAGGFCLIIIIAVLILAVKFSKLRDSLRNNPRAAGATDDLSKRGFSAYTPKTDVPVQTVVVAAPPVQQQQQPFSPPPVAHPQSFSPQVTSPTRQGGYNYDNPSYVDQQQELRVRLANRAGGNGVQVLPKNPPPQRGGQQTDGFY